MTYMRVISNLDLAAAAIRRHDKEEGIAQQMLEGQTLQRIFDEDERSHVRHEAIANIEKAIRLIKRSWS